MISEETINVWFALCVWVLDDLAQMLGMSYNAINIWIFVIIEPIIFLIMLVVLIRQRNTIKKYKQSAASLQ